MSRVPTAAEAATAAKDPEAVLSWVGEKIRREAMSPKGRGPDRKVRLPARLALPEALEELRRLGYSVAEERPGGPWAVGWKEG